MIVFIWIFLGFYLRHQGSGFCISFDNDRSIAKLDYENCGIFKQIPHNILYSTGECLGFDHNQGNIKLVKCGKFPRFEFGQSYFISGTSYAFANSNVRSTIVEPNTANGIDAFKRMYERAPGVTVSSGTHN